MIKPKLLHKLMLYAMAGLLSWNAVPVNSALANDRARFEFKGGGRIEQVGPETWQFIQRDGKKLPPMTRAWGQPPKLLELVTQDKKIKLVIFDNAAYIHQIGKPQSFPKIDDGKWFFPSPSGPPPQTLNLADIEGTWIGIPNQWIFHIWKSGATWGWTVPSNGETGTGKILDHKRVQIESISTFGPIKIPGKVIAWDGSGRPTIIKWENNVVFERMQGGGQGGQGGPGPPPILPPVLNTVDISGRWIGPFGIPYDINKLGNGYTWKLLGETAHVTVAPDRRITGHVGYFFGNGREIWGRVTAVDASNRAVQIVWDHNGWFFNR